MSEENQRLHTIETYLPNPGCYLIDSVAKLDPETGDYVVRYRQSPGFHPCVIQNVTILSPVADRERVRFERVQEEPMPGFETPELKAEDLERVLGSVGKGMTGKEILEMLDTHGRWR